MVCQPYNLSWFISTVTTRASTSLPHKYSNHTKRDSTIFTPAWSNQWNYSKFSWNKSCLYGSNSTVDKINTNKYFKFKRISTKLRWWTRVKTFNSARNSFVACISIFLIAAFCISKIIGLYNESMIFKKNRIWVAF